MRIHRRFVRTGVDSLQEVFDLSESRDPDDQAFAQQKTNLVNQHQLRRVGYGDSESSIFHLFYGEEVVSEHQCGRHSCKNPRCQFEIAEISKLTAITGC